MGTDFFENSEETLSFSNNSRRFYYDLNSSDPPTLLLSFQNNQAIEFLNNSINGKDGAAISVVPTGYGNSKGQVAFSGNAGSIKFINNTTTNDGGAIAGGWLGLANQPELAGRRLVHAGSPQRTNQPERQPQRLLQLLSCCPPAVGRESGPRPVHHKHS
ncbi:hypothetical protein [uncultured Akkermansia sp.]|nr:hypothetical protein [uncultured Akkermansia sp.]